MGLDRIIVFEFTIRFEYSALFGASSMRRRPTLSMRVSYVEGAEMSRNSGPAIISILKFLLRLGQGVSIGGELVFEITDFIQASSH